MDINKIRQRQQIGTLATDTLVHLAEKSKFAVLAEKFLNLSFEKNKTILFELEKQKKQNRLFWVAFSSVPLAALLPFFLKDTYLLPILQKENSCRLFTGISIGLIVCTYLMLSTRFYIALLIVPVVTYIVYILFDESFFFDLLGTSQKRLAFTLLALGHGIVPMCRLWAGIWQTLKDLLRWLAFGKRSKGEKDMAASLQQALHESSEVKKRELEELIKNYHPEYASLLEHLKDPVENAASVDLTIPPATSSPKPNSEAILPLYLGVDKTGQHRWIDLAELPNMIVAGTKGSGKSNFLKHIVASFNHLGNAEILIIDQQQVDFIPFHSPPRLSVFVANQCTEVTSYIFKEIEKRKALFLKKGIVQLSEWSGRGKPNHIIFIIDEYAQLLDDTSFQTAVCQITETGRKWGVSVVIGTQRPSAKVINPRVGANIEYIMAFRAANKNNARILRAPQAHLIPKGNAGMGFFVEGEEALFMVQTPLAKKIRGGSGIPGGSRELYLPAHTGENGAFFVSHRDLIQRLKCDPKKLGFTKRRKWKENSFKRGYWVKQVIKG